MNYIKIFKRLSSRKMQLWPNIQKTKPDQRPMLEKLEINPPLRSEKTDFFFFEHQTDYNQFPSTFRYTQSTNKSTPEFQLKF